MRKNKLFMVETLSTFRIRYVVRAKSDEQAHNEILKFDENLKEFSQKHIGESILDTKEITEKEYLELFDKDNDYLKSWEKGAKMNMINVRIMK